MSCHCLVCVRLSHSIKDYLLTYLLKNVIISITTFKAYFSSFWPNDRQWSRQKKKCTSNFVLFLMGKYTFRPIFVPLLVVWCCELVTIRRSHASNASLTTAPARWQADVVWLCCIRYNCHVVHRSSVQSQPICSSVRSSSRMSPHVWPISCIYHSRFSSPTYTVFLRGILQWNLRVMRVLT